MIDRSGHLILSRWLKHGRPDGINADGFADDPGVIPDDLISLVSDIGGGFDPDGWLSYPVLGKIQVTVNQMNLPVLCLEAGVQVIAGVPVGLRIAGVKMDLFPGHDG